MTKRTGRTSQRINTIKALLLAGSVMATLAGTRILALQEPLETNSPVAVSEAVTVVVPAAELTGIPLPPTTRKTKIELVPIPEVVRPKLNPVARTRSSR